MIRKFVLRWLFNVAGIWVATELISGISYGGEISVLLVAGLLVSIVNSLVRPFVVILALPFIMLTLGLFTLIVNGAMLYLVSLIYSGFVISNFWVAVLAAIILSLVNYILNLVLREE